MGASQLFEELRRSSIFCQHDIMRLKQVLGMIFLIGFIAFLGYQLTENWAGLEDNLLTLFFFSVVGLVLIWAIARILNN